MIETIKAFRSVMESNKVYPELGSWTQPIVYPYWVYEVLESSASTESGMEEQTIILDGFNRGNLAALLRIHDVINKAFKNGVTVIGDDGSTLCFTYGGFTFPDTGIESLKRIEITFDVRKWRI